MTPCLVNAVTKYDQRGASSRVRFKNLFPELMARGWKIRHFPLLTDDVLARFYQTKSHDYGLIAKNYTRFLCALLTARRPAIWWIEKELLAGLPSGVEALLMPILDRAVIDYDDGVYLEFRDHRWGSFGRAHKFPRYARRAAHITVGSEALRQQFRAWGATRLTKIPSTVAVNRYPVHSDPYVKAGTVNSEGGATRRDPGYPHTRSRSDPLAVVTIGWIGTPMTAHFLEPLSEAFQELARRQRIRLCVVGAEWQCEGVDVVCQRWSETTEAELVSSFDIGIMPLIDAPWERAKCGYKLIQYMAAGVASIGSRVGENTIIIDEGENGLLASALPEWMAQLSRLCAEPALRATLGAAARAKAQACYDISCAAQIVHEVFQQVNERRGP